MKRMITIETISVNYKILNNKIISMYNRKKNRGISQFLKLKMKSLMLISDGYTAWQEEQATFNKED